MIDWGTIADKCHKEMARVRAELEAAGLPIDVVIHHDENGGASVVHMHVDEHQEAKAHEWAHGRGHKTHVHRRGAHVSH